MTRRCGELKGDGSQDKPGKGEGKGHKAAKAEKKAKATKATESTEQPK